MDYRETWQSVLAEIAELTRRMAELTKQRAEMDERMRHLRTLARTLGQMLGVKEASTGAQFNELINVVQIDTGVSDAIRQVLAGSGIPLSAPEIKRTLEQFGFDLSGYANSSAVIHNTLTRLVKQGEVARIDNLPEHTVTYVLVRPPRAEFLLAPKLTMPEPPPGWKEK